jgi:ribosomal protein L4
MTSQTHRNKKRAAKRRKKVNEEGHTAKVRTIFEHVQLADAVEAAIKLQALPVAKGAYSARRLARNRFDLMKEYTLAELDGFGFTVLRWDGRYACKSLPGFTHPVYLQGSSPDY